MSNFSNFSLGFILKLLFDSSLFFGDSLRLSLHVVLDNLVFDLEEAASTTILCAFFDPIGFCFYICRAVI